MQAKHSLEFARAPAVWSMYPKILVSRKPSLVPEGAEVPRIEARLAKVVIDRKHLAQYSEICGAAAGATLPIAYPHILATPLHLAMIGAEAFPVKMFGLVHVHNRIAMREPLSAEEPAEIRCWIEGHRETERGQEFELHTEYVVGGEPRWDETCTFLARRRSPPGAGKTTTVARGIEGSPDAQAIRSSSFRAPAGLGRRYGFISGDVNPIHMSDLTARAFGFPKAIAHGMWSLARLASDFEPAQFDGGCELSVNFKLPIYMPSWLMLQRWSIENGTGFALRDAQGEKPHLAGTLKSLR
jgi:MaoC dehydratase-like protein